MKKIKKIIKLLPAVCLTAIPTTLATSCSDKNDDVITFGVHWDTTYVNVSGKNNAILDKDYTCNVTLKNKDYFLSVYDFSVKIGSVNLIPGQFTYDGNIFTIKKQYIDDKIEISTKPRTKSGYSVQLISDDKGTITGDDWSDGSKDYEATYTVTDSSVSYFDVDQLSVCRGGVAILQKEMLPDGSYITNYEVQQINDSKSFKILVKKHVLDAPITIYANSLDVFSIEVDQVKAKENHVAIRTQDLNAPHFVGIKSLIHIIVDKPYVCDETYFKISMITENEFGINQETIIPIDSYLYLIGDGQIRLTPELTLTPNLKAIKIDFWKPMPEQAKIEYEDEFKDKQISTCPELYLARKNVKFECNVVPYVDNPLPTDEQFQIYEVGDGEEKLLKNGKDYTYDWEKTGRLVLPAETTNKSLKFIVDVSPIDTIKCYFYGNNCKYRGIGTYPEDLSMEAPLEKNMRYRIDQSFNIVINPGNVYREIAVYSREGIVISALLGERIEDYVRDDIHYAQYKIDIPPFFITDSVSFVVITAPAHPEPEKLN